MAGTIGGMTNYLGVDMSIVAQKKPSLSETHPELAKQWSDKNGLRADEVTSGSNKKVWWVCAEGHEWEAVVANRALRGTGCPYCSGRKPVQGVNDLATLKPELISEWSPRNSILPSEISIGSQTKVWWVCAEGHEWEAPVHARSRGGCPYCSNHRVWPGFNDLATFRPDIASEWSARNALASNKVTVGSGKKVWWVCEKGHEWKVSVAKRTGRGDGCPYCSNQAVLSGYNDLTTTHPVLATEWSPRNILTPKDVIAGSNKKVWWVGVCGHEWDAPLNMRSQGQGCPICSGKRVLQGFNDLKTTHPELAAQWSNNNSLKPSEISVGTHIKVWWVCDKKHEWLAAVHSRTRSGCPYCSNRRILVGDNDILTLYPWVKEFLDETEYKRLDKIIPRGKGHVKLHCPTCDYKWEPLVKNVTTRNQTCPRCNFGQSSKIEVSLLKSLSSYAIVPQYRVNYTGGFMRLDGFFDKNSLKFAVEYDGAYWHNDTIEKDIDKTRILLDKNYYVIRVREVSPHIQLGFLPIEHDNLFQIKFDYTADYCNLPVVVEQIQEFVETR